MLSVKLLVVGLLCVGLRSAFVTQLNRSSSSPRSASVQFQAVPASDAHWIPGPSPGSEVAVLWGQPQDGRVGGERYRFKPGFASPEHTHPFHERAVVFGGTFVIARPGESPKRLGAGSYFFIPANTVHATRCESTEPCELYNEVVAELP
jgi:quercetin dioxygenase-like cupin family protein